MQPTIGQVSKEVVTDPGVGFGVRNALLFAANTNMVGLTSTIIAATIATGAKILSQTKPAFLERHPDIARVVKDGRTPLQAIGLSLLVVGGAAFAMGAWLPAATSFLFAVANFRNAESIAARLRAGKGEVKDTPQEGSRLKKLALLTLKRPDLYINLGFAASGLMSGGLAWIAFPVIAAAFGISMRNAMQEMPEYKTHPKAISSAAGLVFAGIGFATGNVWPAISHLIGSAVLFNIETRVTPGGMKQVLKDIGSGVASLFGGGSKQKQEEPAPQTPRLDEVLKAPAIARPGELSASFQSSLQKTPEKTREAVAQPAYLPLSTPK